MKKNLDFLVNGEQKWGASEGANDHCALLKYSLGLNQYSPYVIMARTQTKKLTMKGGYLNMHTLSYNA